VVQFFFLISNLTIALALEILIAVSICYLLKIDGMTKVELVSTDSYHVYQF
jgi:hypothetical protein